MAVQAPVFSDSLGFPVNGSAQDWMAMGFNSGFGSPDLVQPLPIDGLLNTGFLDRHPAAAPASFPSHVHVLDLQLANVFAGELKRQRSETDRFLQLQNERFKYTIQRQKKKQITALLSSIESRTLAALRKTEQDLARVTRRTRELEDCLRRAEFEIQAWQRIARENDARIVGLKNLLGRAQEMQCWAAGGGPAQDAESVCECDGENDKTENQNEVLTWKMTCRGCKSERSCMVFLPCKHLCACRECGELLGLCPLCGFVKEGSIEVFLK